MPENENSSRPDIFFKIAYFAILIKILIGPLLQAFKLIKVSHAPGAWMFYIFLPLSAALFFFSAFSKKINIKNLDQIEVAFILLFIWAIFTTIIFQGSYLDISGNILRIVLSLTCYHTTKRYINSNTFYNFEKKIVPYGFFGVVFAIILTYSSVLTGGSVYLGLSTENIFPMIIRSILYGIPLGLLGFTLVLMGGKRGPMLAMIITYFYYSLFFLKKSKLIFRATILAFLVFLFSIISFISFTAFYESLPRPLQSRIEPYMIDDFENADLNTLTSKRSSEVEGVIEQWTTNPVMFFTGMGYGAWFIDTYGLKDNTVHFSPVAFTHLYGIFFSFWFYFLFARLFYKSTKKAIREKDKKLQFWVLVTFSFFFSTFAVFELLQNPIIWIGFARLQSDIKNKINS